MLVTVLLGSLYLLLPGHIKVKRSASLLRHRALYMTSLLLRHLALEVVAATITKSPLTAQLVIKMACISAIALALLFAWSFKQTTAVTLTMVDVSGIQALLINATGA